MFIVKCVNLENGWVVYKMSYNVLQIPEGGDYEAQNLI
jgi:hypothetical protein